MAKQNEGWMTPVPRQSLSKMVVEKIKEGLISGEIVPGEYLPSENELTERLGLENPASGKQLKCWKQWGLWKSVKATAAECGQAWTPIL